MRSSATRPVSTRQLAIKICRHNATNILDDIQDAVACKSKNGASKKHTSGNNKDEFEAPNDCSIGSFVGILKCIWEALGSGDVTVAILRMGLDERVLASRNHATNRLLYNGSGIHTMPVPVSHHALHLF